MKDLQQYVARKNEWYALFGKQSNYLDLSKPADRQRVANMLDADLSPENLTCDGELPRAEVIARKRTLDKVVVQLLALDPSVKMYEYC